MNRSAKEKPITNQWIVVVGVVLVMVAILTKPAEFTIRWLSEFSLGSRRTTIHVPDGGSLLMAGVAFRPDGSRRHSNGNRTLPGGIIIDSEGRVLSRPSSAEGGIMTLITTRILIQEDDESLILSTTSGRE